MDDTGGFVFMGEPQAPKTGLAKHCRIVINGGEFTRTDTLQICQPWYLFSSFNRHHPHPRRTRSPVS